MIGGTPPELLAHPDALKLYLPALKADLQLVETYRCVGSVHLWSPSPGSCEPAVSCPACSCSPPERPPLSCPVTCFDGMDDVPHDLEGQASGCSHQVCLVHILMWTKQTCSCLSCPAAWSSITSGDFTVRRLPGAHFYLKDAANEKVLLDYISKQLETAQMDYF